MGTVKLELKENNENLDSQGKEVSEIGQEKVADAQKSSDTMQNLECVDDDVRADTDKAINESRTIAASVSESEIKNPTREIGEGFGEVQNEATENAAVDRASSAKAGSEIVGDYSNIGASLSQSFENSAVQFESISEDAERLNSDMQERNANLANLLESAF